MNIEDILKHSKKSVTHERKEIYEFMQTHHLVSSSQLIAQFSRIGRASIFRILKLFIDLGVVRRVGVEDTHDLYEIIDQTHHHEHMKCMQCGNIVSFESHDICQMILTQAQKLGFEVKEHVINIKGICAVCRISHK